MRYAKDTQKDNLIANYSGTFGKVDLIAVQLINSCKYVYRDNGGEYVYDAALHSEPGHVIFTKRYL
jgi:hypothetical protein